MKEKVARAENTFVRKDLPILIRGLEKDQFKALGRTSWI
jgi:hypothetical protein